MSETLLSIKNLKTYFVTDEAVLKAVDDVSFDSFKRARCWDWSERAAVEKA